MKKIILIVLVIFLGMTNICSAKSLWNGNKYRNVVALTFDDGPKPEFVLPILSELDKYGAKATFFVVGIEAKNNPDLIMRMYDSGYEVANHTYSHIPAKELSAKETLNDIERCNLVIEDITGQRPIYYRPPGGGISDGISKGLKDLKMKAIFWSLNGTDYTETTPGFEVPDDYQLLANDLAKKVLDKVKPGTIILLHSSSEQTVRALPVILKGLKEKGYGMVTIRDLVEEKI